MNTGDRIKARREELGMTQDELAKRLGYKSRSSINKMEVSDRDMPRKKIVEIANALKVTPVYLMGWEDKAFIDEVYAVSRASDLSSLEAEIMEKIQTIRPGFQKALIPVIDSLLEMQANADAVKKEEGR